MYVNGSIPILYYPLAEVAGGGVAPPSGNNFELLDGTGFLLLDATDFLLLEP